LKKEGKGERGDRKGEFWATHWLAGWLAGWNEVFYLFGYCLRAFFFALRKIKYTGEAWNRWQEMRLNHRFSPFIPASFLFAIDFLWIIVSFGNSRK
jgi:hypothetical protein